MVNNDYLVLKPSESYKINATITPFDAPGELAFKSLDTTIADVSVSGTVTAKKVGVTSVVVSNIDAAKTVFVIVNWTNTSNTRNPSLSLTLERDRNGDSFDTVESLIISEIQRSNGLVSVSMADCPILTNSILKALNETGLQFQ